MKITLVVATCGIFSPSLAIPLRQYVDAPRSLEARDNYVMFGGDGSRNAGWPAQTDWMDFDKAWAVNLKVIQQSCQNNGWGPNNDAKETIAIRTSIEEESKASGIPKELILAVIMQESNGCVRVVTTQSDSNNPGLMQSAGQATCHPLGAKPITPCPTSTIRQMIHDGTAGEGLRTTLKNSLESFDPADESKWYKTVRRYNAGSSMDAGNLGNGPTPCYTSDIANRLINPSSRSSCESNEIKTLTRAKTGFSSSHDGANLAVQDIGTSKPASTPNVPVIQPHSDAAPPKLDKGLESNNGGTIQTGINNPSDPIIAGAAVGCTKYYTPQSGASCQSAPVDLATLRRLNSQLNALCTNLWAGYAYCVAT